MHYSSLAKLYEALSQTTKRLEKTKLLADFLAHEKLSDEDLERVILLVQGRVFPRWDKRTLGVSSKLAAKAVAQASAEPEKKVMDVWRKLGDLGKVAAELMTQGKQATLFTQDLHVEDVFTALRKLPAIEGKGSVDLKLKTIARLLSAARPNEAQYLLRTVLEELRVGIAEGTLRDAICWAYLDPPVEFDTDKKDLVLKSERARAEYNQLLAVVQAAYDRSNDFAVVAKIAKTGGVDALKQIKFTLGTPVRVMLAQREASVHDALERVGRPCALEFKYDGFRMQVHKKDDTITIFTRRLENVTEQFPEVVQAVKDRVKANRCILDCEAVGYDKQTGKYTPFQAISQRIRRKYDIDQLAEKLPIELCMFDILLYEKHEVLDRPFKERRELLEKLLDKDLPKTIRLSQYLETESDGAGEAFYKEAIASGNEGLMAKNLAGPYKPGSRVGHMVKVKPTLDTMDLVIVEAEWGEGKRSGWLTSFTLACYDPVEDEFLTVGKVGTGLKELEHAESGDSDDPSAVTFDKLTKLLQEDILEQDGRHVVVKPRVVIEIKFEEVQQSPSYQSGFALRFPRVVKLRDDRSPDSATDIEEIRLAFAKQRGGR